MPTTSPRSRPGIAAVALSVLSAVLAGVAPALAAKWAAGQCPRSRLKYLSVAHHGYVSSPFIHPGRDMTFHLRETEVKVTGGFSIEPDGNLVTLTFTPIGGEPIPLPPFRVAAVSAATITFPFPDSRELLGRAVGSPIHVEVRRGDTVVVDTKPGRLLALPPANDVRALVSQRTSVDAYGTLDPEGGLWIPIWFGGFDPGEPMPTCPMPVTEKLALAVSVKVWKGADEEPIPFTSQKIFRRGGLYFGDFQMEGVNLYGNEMRAQLSARRIRGVGLVLCALNDTVDLVARVRLPGRALGKQSTLLAAVRDGSPVRITLTDVSAEPEVADALRSVREDAFGSLCTTAR